MNGLFFHFFVLEMNTNNGNFPSGNIKNIVEYSSEESATTQ